MVEKKPGRNFEEAVCAFAKTLDGSAEVIFNYKVPDRDTGEFRQCDVWINAKYGGHWPISILVSCKDHRRKIHSGDIGTFCDEKRSTGASTGVIYSRSGFTAPAIKKAKANGIACCRLYSDEPADLPASVWFERYLCRPAIQIAVLTDLRNTSICTWNDLFAAADDGNDKTVLDVIAEAFSVGETRVVADFLTPTEPAAVGFPAAWSRNLSLKLAGIDEGIRVRVGGFWRKYQARLEATLLSGSYCVSDGSFRGTQSGPPIDTQGAHPGEAWQEIGEEVIRPHSRHAVAVLSGSDIRNVLIEKLGATAISGLKK